MRSVRVAIRGVVETELDRLFTLRLEALEREPGAFGMTVEAERAGAEAWRLRTRRMMATEGTVLVAEAEGALVGTVGVERFFPPRARHGARLIALYVAPAWRSSGIGGALVERAIAWARRAGLRRLELHVAAENPKAMRLYERLGFRRVGTLREALRDGDRYVDEHIYELLLGG